MSTPPEKKKHRKSIVCKKCKIEKPYLSFSKPTKQYFDRADICKVCEHKMWGNTNHMTFKKKYDEEDYQVLNEMMDLMGYDTTKNLHIQFLMRHGLLK